MTFGPPTVLSPHRVRWLAPLIVGALAAGIGRHRRHSRDGGGRADGRDQGADPARARAGPPAVGRHDRGHAAADRQADRRGHRRPERHRPIGAATKPATARASPARRQVPRDRRTARRPGRSRSCSRSTAAASLDQADPLADHHRSGARAGRADPQRRASAPGGATLMVIAPPSTTGPSTLPVAARRRRAPGRTLDAAAQRPAPSAPFLLTRARRRRRRHPAHPRRVRRRRHAGSPRTAEVTLELTSDHEDHDGRSTRPALAYEDELVVTGKVTDEDGQPGRPRRGHAAVRRSPPRPGRDRRRRHLSLRGRGRDHRQQGQFGVQVQADPGSPYVQPSRLAARDHQDRRAAAGAGLVHDRRVPRDRARRRRLLHRARQAVARGSAAPRRPPRCPRTPTASRARPTAASSSPARRRLDAAPPLRRRLLRRRPRHRARPAGRRRGRPPRCSATASASCRTAADGSFPFEKLAAGEWRAEVAAPGHVTERFAVTIPHRGELRGVRVDLVPVRERVFQLYRRAAEPILPEPRLWGIWSPRQIVDHVRGKRPSPALADLTDFVEEIYFSARARRRRPSSRRPPSASTARSASASGRRSPRGRLVSYTARRCTDRADHSSRSRSS